MWWVFSPQWKDIKKNGEENRMCKKWKHKKDQEKSEEIKKEDKNCERKRFKEIEEGKWEKIKKLRNK